MTRKDPRCLHRNEDGNLCGEMDISKFSKKDSGRYRFPNRCDKHSLAHFKVGKVGNNTAGRRNKKISPEERQMEDFHILPDSMKSLSRRAWV